MAEFLRLDWSDVHLERGLVSVRAEQAKTAARRSIPLCKTGCELLRPLWTCSGKVAHYSQENKFTEAAKNAVNQRRKSVLGISDRFTWKRNALRHSFCSYRLAILRDVGKVAYEAGNSPNMIHKHYHELVTKEDAQLWFQAKPITSQSQND